MVLFDPIFNIILHV